MYNDIGQRLKQLRVNRKLTQLQLANMIGLANTAISSYESGARFPSYDILIKYTKIFHVSSDYLLGIEKNRSIDISDMNDTETEAIMQVITAFRNANNTRKKY